MISQDELPQKEKTSSSSQPVSLSSLPDEIIENILARIRRWAYPNLFLVCKRFMSLLSSPQLNTARFNLGTTEPCLYLCLGSVYDDTPPQWFTLSMKPQETLSVVGEREILNDYSLVPIPSSPPSVSYGASTVAVGSDIYVIGGHVKLSSSVRILDCRSNTWRDAPNMTVARSGAQAVYLDEKIYVMGGYRGIDQSSHNWFEVFDIKTQTWRALPSPDVDGHELSKYIVVIPDALERKFYVASARKDYTYEPEDGTWKVEREKSSFREILNSCVIENVMYCCCRSGCLKWYDSEAREWREIKGLERFLFDKVLVRIVRIVNYGGKLVVMWKFRINQKVGILCTKFALEKRSKDEIWGKMESHNIVLMAPESYNCFTCVVVLI